MARELIQQNHAVVVSTASDYGRELAEANVPQANVVSGRMGPQARGQLLKDRSARAIVDATHPFASEISRQLQELALELDLPYVRYERASAPRSEFAHYCPDVGTAAAEALRRGKRIFLATGIKSLPLFLATPGAEKAEWFVRITPEKDSLEQALATGIPHSHICAMQGPFSRQLNASLWKEWGIDCVVTKESGDAGGFSEKLKAARELGLELVVIERPAIEYPVICTTFPEAIHAVNQLLQNEPTLTL